MHWNGRKGIRVNALAPGFLPSEMTGQLADGYLDSQLPYIPAGRTGDPCKLRLRSFSPQVPLRAP